MKVRRYSYVRRFVYLSGILLLVAYITLGFLVYRRFQGLMLKQIRRNAMDIAGSCAALIDAEAFSRLYPGAEDTKDYNTVEDALILFRDNSGLEYVYTVWYDETGIPVFCVDSDPEDRALIGESFDYSNATLLALQGEVAADDTPMTDKWGTHMSAYAPIVHEKEVLGAVGVDISFSWILAENTNIIVLIITTIVICFTISVGFLLLLGNNMQKKFLLLNNKLDDLLVGTDELRKVQGLHEGDEFEILADHINDVFKKNNAVKENMSELKEDHMEPGLESELQKRFATTGILDYDEAVRLLSSDELIENTMRQFYEDIDRNLYEMDKMLKEGDIENFTVRVHALKSGSRMIGATLFSRKAEYMEKLGNQAANV